MTGDAAAPLSSSTSGVKTVQTSLHGWISTRAGEDIPSTAVSVARYPRIRLDAEPLADCHASSPRKEEGAASSPSCAIQAAAGRATAPGS